MKLQPSIPLLLIFLSISGAFTASYYASKSSLKKPTQIPVRKPFTNPFSAGIAGVGIVESKSKNIRIAPFFAGKIESVAVAETERVRRGTVLYRLDCQQLKAELRSQKQQIAALTTRLERLRNEPRDVNVAPAQAIVKAREARVNDVQQNLERYERLYHQGAVSENDTVTRRYELQAATAQLTEATAELKKLTSGVWHFDLEQAEHELAQAKARSEEIETKIQQSTIRSPIDGEILQVNVRAGEFVKTDGPEPSVLLGTTDTLQVRVDIDEVNASRIKPGMPALACLKGNSDQKFPLSFVRVEPFMVPKKSLTGNTSERNDVRVLQLIYQFKRTDAFPVYVGQQLEVFLTACSY
ncbi:MAG: efflux RND transporter periplasmic adaptor subunit [Candidatus Obscuribacterales bacterium]|nr:efflux RND transporter periplasmic adaptor subunit [Candidatus Obscuribacterales bacterium]